MSRPPVLHRAIDAVANWLIRWRGTFLLLTLVLAAAAIPLASRLQLEESIESFFAADDPLLLAWQDSKRWFGGDEFVLVGYSTDDPTETNHLNRLREFARELSGVPGIRPESTQSLEGLLRPSFGTTFAERAVARSYARVRQEDILEFGEHLVISSDRKTTAIVLRLLPESESPVPRAETFARVRELAAAHQPRAYVGGEPIQVHDMFRYVEQDSTVLGWASSGLLIAVILFLFRSLRWVALPLLVVHVTLVWTKAILVLSGLRLSMVSSMLTSLVTIIGIATVTHFTVSFRAFRKTLPRMEAFHATFVELAAPVFWTCVTTAIGFGALLSSSITPVRSFGLMLAVAAMLVLVVAALVLPGGALIGRFDQDPRQTPLESRLVRGLGRLSRGLDFRPKTLLIALLALMVFGGVGLLFLRVETDFTKNFRKSSRIVQAVEFFEQRLGGVGSWEVHFDAPEEITDESLDPIRALAADLREVSLEDGTSLTKVVALSDGVDFAPGLGISQKLKRLEAIQPEFVTSLYAPETAEGTGKMRIVLRAMEQQPAEVKLALIDAVAAAARERYPEARPTGLYLLLAELISSLLRDQLTSFLLASAGIFVCMTIAFRNLWIGLISLLPNVFPLLLVIGGMGWTGVPVNIGTAMIASVSMGLTVDSSIHYTAGYLRARRGGASHSDAVWQTHGSVGMALVFAHIVLVFGFLVLSLSNFIPLVYFGVLVSLSMLGGLLGDLVLLPLLLKWIPLRLPETVVATAHDQPAAVHS